MIIPGVETVHERHVWDRLVPSPYKFAENQSPAQDWSQIYRPVAHYTAADDLIDGDPGEHAEDLPAYIAAMQRDYSKNRGYNVGYLFAVDWLGGVWELRGFDYRSAANASHNTYTFPVLFLVDGDDRPTVEAAAAARAIWREARRRSSSRVPFEGRPWGHGQLYLETGVGTPTSCPGAGIRAALADGSLDLDYDAPTVPEPDIPDIPIIGEDDMTAVLWRHPKYREVFLVGAGGVINVSPKLYQHYVALGVPSFVEAHNGLLQTTLFNAGMNLGDLTSV